MTLPFSISLHSLSLSPSLLTLLSLFSSFSHYLSIALTGTLLTHTMEVSLFNSVWRPQSPLSWAAKSPLPPHVVDESVSA